MSNIKTWSTTAASNNSAAPDGWPEGMAPSDVNNSAREMMAAIRTQHEDSAWIDLGDTPTQTGATTFTLVGDVTTAYAVGRRIRATDASTLYGSITASAFTSLTTITVLLDSGVLSGSLTEVALGILDAKAAQPAGNFTVTGDIAVTGTVDGRDIATDGAALDALGVQNVALNTKVVDIGDWNMDATGSVNVAHGLTFADIRNVSIMIRNDVDNSYSNLFYDDGVSVGGYFICNSTNVVLHRITSGAFDSTAYNSTSYNRGWVTITYV